MLYMLYNNSKCTLVGS